MTLLFPASAAINRPSKQKMMMFWIPSGAAISDATTRNFTLMKTLSFMHHCVVRFFQSQKK